MCLLEQNLPGVDASWSSEQLANAVCDLLVAKGYLKEKPAFIKSDRQAKLISIFATAGIDGQRMLKYDNPGPLEMAIRKGTNGEAWVQQVMDALISMLPEETAKASKKILMDEDAKEALATAKARTQQRRAASLRDSTESVQRHSAEQAYSIAEIVNLPNSLRVAKQKYPRDADIFMKYLCNNFVVSHNDALKRLADLWDLPDAEAYHEMRKLFLGEMKDSYDRNLGRKVEQVQKMLGDSQALRCLDLGTEHPLFLEKMEMAFGGACFGINVEGPAYSQFSHEFDEGLKCNKIMLYDGLHLADAIKTAQQKEMTFDLVTILSVLHHIPDDHLLELAKEIAEVCSGYVVIKDNDLQSSEKHQLFTKIQADVYAGQLLPGSPCYINYNVSKKKVLSAFQEYFEVEKEFVKRNFTGAYWLLLKKR